MILFGEDIWSLAGSTRSWRMVLEGSTGHSGAFGRQVSLTRQSADSIETSNLLEALEQQVMMKRFYCRVKSVYRRSRESFLALEFSDAYHHRDESTYYEGQLLNLARNGRLVLTLR